MWFEQLMGFAEETPEQVRQNIEFQGNTLTSRINGQTYHCGTLEVPSLTELRNQAEGLLGKKKGRLQAREVIGNVQDFHKEPENAHALFQAASQFNLLEMASPHATPEEGVGIYEFDRTQGPACAIVCGAGTIVRNYFVELGDQIGQTASLQVDCLKGLGNFFGNEESTLWHMQNGYAFATEAGLMNISKKIEGLSTQEYESAKGLLQLGIQWDTEVILSPQRHKVSQVYCSALPVGYSHIYPEKWEAFARLILEATYEATLFTTLINRAKTGSNKVFLTLVGGGVFANEEEWIIESIIRNLLRFKEEELDVQFVSYGGSNPVVQEILSQFAQSTL